MKRTFTTFIPKERAVVMETVSNDVRTTERIIIEKHKLKTTLSLPCYPAMNPEIAFKTIAKCYKEKSPHAAALYLLILTQLQRRDQDNIVNLEQKEVAEYLEQSVGTINKAFQVLEKLEVITKIGNGKYKVSPLVAFVGSHIEWAEQLKSLANETLKLDLNLVGRSIEQ